jgi:metal-responsive CopG/Arc/MetJ family transcriptional regulator
MVKEHDVDNEPKEQRVPLMMEASLLDQVDDYRLTKKIWSRSEAIRNLIREGLQKEMPAQTGE